jgi:hypothetical protein
MSAQGWRDEGAPTLGKQNTASTLKGLHPARSRLPLDATLSGLARVVGRFPRVARSSQPWADLWNAFGVRDAHADSIALAIW